MTDERPALRAVGGGDAAAASIEPDDQAVAHGGIIPPTRSGARGRFISDVIVELGFLPRERVEAAVEEARGSGRTPEQVLLQTGAISADQLARATAERFGLDYADLTVYRPDLAAANLISSEAARRYSAVPIGFDSDARLIVAMSDPANVLALDDLKLLTGQEIHPAVASVEDIGALVGRMRHLDDAVAQAAEAHDEEEGIGGVEEIRGSAEDAPVIKLVNSVIAQAVGEGASDIHFEPEGRDMRVRFRVDGVLRETTSIPRRMVAGVVSRVKIMGNLDIAERRRPQDGRVTLTVEGNPVDIRIVTMPSVLGEGAVLRLLDKSEGLLELDALGLQGAGLARFQRAYGQAYGAVIVTGPTGSGKSTTLYAALSNLNSPERKIITIEDPVEYQLPGINQIQVHARAGLGFATGLRSILRADPDVIMVGEIRDLDTARIGIEAALTGHLVLSTLHTNDAPSAITRLTEMGIEPFLSASAIDCVVAQRLARTLCKHCKQRTMLTADALRGAGFEVSFDIEAYEPVGCSRCNHSGYRGRIGLFEVMELNEEIRTLTIERASSDAIRRAAVQAGMRLLRDDALDKVRQGVTSIAEVTRVT